MNWKSDLKQLKEELPKSHNFLFHNITEKEFNDKIDQLEASREKINPYKMVVEFSKIIASVGDAHTMLEIPKNNMLPFKVFNFEEGIYMIGVTKGLEPLTNKKIIEIEGTPIEEIIEKLTEIISHENKQFVKSQLPALLTCSDILYGLDLCNSVNEVEITYEISEGLYSKKILNSILLSQWQSIFSDLNNNENNVPLYRKHKELNYWCQLIENNTKLYVNYKKCKEMDERPINNFIEGLKVTIEEYKCDKIIIDFRNNNGGNSELFRPFLEWIAKYEKRKSGFEILVIVGRDTFSSALLNVFFLKFNTKAIFVGEATGGKPNCYGEVKYFKLKESGLYVRYSTRYYYLIDDYSWDSFYPDIILPVSINDYINNIDKCEEYY